MRSAPPPRSCAVSMPPVPLDDAELEALPHLIAARAAIVAVGTEQQAVLEPHNAYAQRVRAGDWAICEAAAAVPLPLAEAAFRLACGRSAAALAPRVPAGVWPLAGIEPGATVDLSPAGLDALTPPGALGAHARGTPACRAGALQRGARDHPPRPGCVRPGRMGGAGAAGRSRRARRRARAACWRPMAWTCAWPGWRRRSRWGRA